MKPMQVPLFDLHMGEEEEVAILEVLRSKWLSTGPRCQEFEGRFSDVLGSKHAVSLSSCTAGLHLALRALGVGPGDEVIVPSLSFVATASSVLMVGAKPVFAEIESLSQWTLCPSSVEECISPKTKAIIPMHYGGFGADMETICQLARSRELKVLEDACHAPLGTRNGRMLGTFGDAACYSFYSNKNITTAEGGMLVTDNEALADRIRLLRSHGMTSTAYERSRGAEFYDVVEYGYNYRLDDLRAAIGLVQLTRLPEDIRRRGELVDRYRSNLKGVQGLYLPFLDYEGRSANYVFPVLLPEGTERKKIREELAERGVSTTMHYPPIHLFSCFQEFTRPLPLTEEIGRREVSLPLFYGMTDGQVDYVCEVLADSL